MPRKVFLLLSIVIFSWSSEKCYVTYHQFKASTQTNQKYLQTLQREQKNKNLIWDDSQLVRLLLHHAEVEDLAVHKIEPQFSNQFNVVMEGSYMHFVKWVAKVSGEECKIYWLKITIKKISSDKQRYALNGVYSG